jgi:exopolysaccharide biosynthesis polyprenyl glycosylphosphotransferase
LLAREPDVRVAEKETDRPVIVPGEAVRLYQRLAVGVAATDTLSLLAAIVVARLVVFGEHKLNVSSGLLIVLTPFICLPIFAAFRLYSLPRLSPAEEFRRIPAAVSVSIGAFVLIGYWSATSFSRSWLALTWILGVVLVLATRRGWHWYMGRRRREGLLSFRTLVVGTNEEARRIARSMTGVNGYTAAGFVCPAGDYVRLEGLPVYELDELNSAIREVGAECVYVASTALGAQKMSVVTKALRDADVEVRVSANISDILSTRLTLQQVGGLMALSLRPVRLSGPQALAKRTLDLCLSSLAILLLLPLWVILYAAIKLDSRGPVFYRQTRIGRHREPFQMMKFRTMVVGADAMIDELREQNEATGPLFKLRRDPRVTRVGRFLRRWSLDELPQLWNVMTGDMSLVGPRPALPPEVDAYEDWHFDRLEVPPGITGLWQVKGRSDLPFDDYVRLDLFYIENWSVGYDLYIMAKTIPAVFAGRGAF